MPEAASAPRRLRFVAALLLWGVPAAVALAGTKDDVVEFRGGSRLVGELKYLERGKLYFKTDTTDTIALDWADVTLVVTKQHLRLERRDGGRSFGSLVTPSAAGRLAIASGDGMVESRFDEIVAIDVVERDVWDRLDVDVSAGYAFTKSTEVEQWNVGLDVDYDTEDRLRTLKATSQSTDAPGESGSLRNVATYQTLKLRGERWATGWLVGAEQNDALDLDYRATLAWGGGPRFFPSADQRIRLFAGLQLNNEKFRGNEAQSSVETVFLGTVDWWRFREPELDLASTLALFPSLTDRGRLRGALDITLRWELLSDFFWELSLFDEYDNSVESDQAGSNASENDYGITTGISWEVK